MIASALKEPAGLPVVALRASGVREVVNDGRTGFMLAPNTAPAKFARQIGRLHADKVLRRKFSAAARAAAENFSREHCAKQALASTNRSGAAPAGSACWPSSTPG